MCSSTETSNGHHRGIRLHANLPQLICNCRVPCTPCRFEPIDLWTAPHGFHGSSHNCRRLRCRHGSHMALDCRVRWPTHGNRSSGECFRVQQLRNVCGNRRRKDKITKFATNERHLLLWMQDVRDFEWTGWPWFNLAILTWSISLCASSSRSFLFTFTMNQQWNHFLEEIEKQNPKRFLIFLFATSISDIFVLCFHSRGTGHSTLFIFSFYWPLKIEIAVRWFHFRKVYNFLISLVWPSELQFAGREKW